MLALRAGPFVLEALSPGLRLCGIVTGGAVSTLLSAIPYGVGKDACAGLTVPAFSPLRGKSQPATLPDVACLRRRPLAGFEPILERGETLTEPLGTWLHSSWKGEPHDQA